MESGSSERLELLADAAAALAGELTVDAVLRRVVEVAVQVTGARYAALGVVGEDQTLVQFVTHGVDEDTARRIGHYPTGKGVLGLLIREPRIVRLDNVRAHPDSSGFPPGHPEMTTFLGGPIRSGGKVFGNLYLTEKEGGFDERDEHVLLVLAAQAGSAIESAQLAQRLQDLAVLEERDRISRDLHDSVIQSLFAIGMSLESTRGLLDRDPQRVEERLRESVDGLDRVIRDLRNFIFHLRPHLGASMGLTAGIAELAREHEVNALVRPTLRVPPDLDVSVPVSVVPDILQILREVLANSAKHAKATRCDVAAGASHRELEVIVSDDGVGFDPRTPSAGRGMENVRERAEALRGSVTIDSGPGEGTRVAVRVPLDDIT